MAKKAELLDEAKKLKLEVSDKNTIAEIAKAIEQAQSKEVRVKSQEKASSEETQDSANEVRTAKAGKRSEKGLKEAEEKTTKVEAQQHREAESEETAKPKVIQKPARSILERKSKKFRKVAEQIEKDKTYSLKEALELATKTSPVKFDATVELHVRLGVDPKQADQNIRDTISLPAGTGKTLRVAVFADPDGVAAAKKAGADLVASDEFLQQLEKGVVDFDILIATPATMPKLGKYARLLGPKGLMPNPKSGTVTTDVAKAVTEAKAGRLEYRVDSTGIVHVGVGKVSFGGEKLLQNVQAIATSIKNNKPGSLKGAYVKSVFVTTSMGPSITVDNSEF